LVKIPDIKPLKPVKPRYLTLNSLPKSCEMVLNAPAVRSAEMAEFKGNGARPLDDVTSVNAYATDTPASAAFGEMEDFSVYVPRGEVPLPYPRPGLN
jgi:penicillin-insensitive murein DD-endopeptidase